MEMKGTLTMAKDNERDARSTEDQRYYMACPLQKRGGRKISVPVTKCFNCDFVLASTADQIINIVCNFPIRRGPK